MQFKNLFKSNIARWEVIKSVAHLNHNFAGGLGKPPVTSPHLLYGSNTGLPYKTVVKITGKMNCKINAILFFKGFGCRHTGPILIFLGRLAFC